MALKNYTTSIKIEKTIAEIEVILTNHGATHISKMYEDSVINAVAFKCMVNDQLIAFKLPMEEKKILQVFKIQAQKGKLAKRYADDLDQARRTGWRIILNWVDSQMALIEIHVVKFEEIFLPYMFDEVNNETLFQKLEKKNFELGYDKEGEYEYQ